MKKYYITSAIAYTSSKPHIGNTYEIVLTDAIARFKRLMGYDVYFQTGTDEHGEKIEIRAKENNYEPYDYATKVTNEIKSIWDIMNISYDKFVRTTDKVHQSVVQNIFVKMYEQGDIYKGVYKGLYCVPCESFWTASQLNDGLCPDCGREVLDKSEEAYFFKLSKYQKRLEDYINDNPDFIKPEARKKEMINNFIKPGLQDLCVSRSSFTWGIPVTIDNNHVIYVWLDALCNYITNIGYDVENKTQEFNNLWPADLHVVGKDIIRFHSIYWPAFLMSLDLPLPKQIFGHPWLIMEDGKMSKSKGNVLYADGLANKYGVDALRYYFLHEIPYSNDGIFSIKLLEERINSDLVNILGNLVNRTVSMINKYFDGKIIVSNCIEDIDNDLFKYKDILKNNIIKNMDNLYISDAIEDIFKVFKRCNKYIDETEPWVLAKDISKNDRLATVLYNLSEMIRYCSVYLQVFLPSTSDEIFKVLNTLNTSIDSDSLTLPLLVNDNIHLFERI